ncbi:MAG: hypothetical protein OZ948_05775 [Deltaproteobacteria bacterium]|nr:hypothetical protein [Deltaproteobacteria bacterium]
MVQPYFWRGIAVAAVVLALGAGTAHAQARPAGEPVRWDQARVTKLAQDLTAAVKQAREAVRKSPMSHNIAQRTTYYELLETMRLVANTAQHLEEMLEAGEDAERTRPVFERVSSLRFEAEEIGRRALIEAPVIDALVKAGAIHNQMTPYYYGKT